MLNRSRFQAWVDARTGLPSVVDRMAEEPVRGGAGLRHVFGSALAGAFLIQLVTGLLLMTSYVPSSSQAWGSVWYINTQMMLGWIVRGLHHFGSSAVVILLVLHLAQTVIRAAYRSPREFNWWLGLLMMFAALGLALTGYLLPWDQKGYWATRVATNIAGSTPVVGPMVQQLLVGGVEYGNQTLTRLYGLHVGLLPLLLILGLLGHWLLARRHGLSGPDGHPRDEAYWPAQTFYNTAAVALVLGTLLTIVLVNGGANLEAPADPSSTDYPARPEWYFLALYQLLNEFESPYEIIGTMVIPGVVVTVLFLLPILDRLLPRRLVHYGACALLLVLIGGAGFLMAKAVVADWDDPAFLFARSEADRQRQRALDVVAAEGLPPEGASYLLARDPLTHGMQVLESKCLSCHAYDGRVQISVALADPPIEDLEAADLATLGPAAEVLPPRAARMLAASAPEGFRGGPVEQPGEDRGGLRVAGVNRDGNRVVLDLVPDASYVVVKTHAAQSASDLQGFGTRAWLRGLLDDPSSPSYFGLVPQCSGMAEWKAGSELTRDELDQIADFFEEHVINQAPGLSAQAWELPFIEAGDDAPPGYLHYNEECADCHAWGLGGADYSGINAPNIAGWGSPTWIKRMIAEPGARDLYGYLEAHERMPGFEAQLTDHDIEVLVRLFEGDYVSPGGLTVSPATEEPAGD